MVFTCSYSIFPTAYAPFHMMHLLLINFGIGNHAFRTMSNVLYFMFTASEVQEKNNMKLISYTVHRTH